MSDRDKAQSTEIQQHFNSRQKVLLLLIVAINICLYGAVWSLRQGSGSSGASSTLTVDEPLELREAHEQSLALALGWQPDVQLVGATTSWQLANGDELTLCRPAWSFSFYSPAVRQIQTVTVDQRGAQAGRQRSVSTAPRPVAPDWELDSDDLLLTFLSYGGEAFIDAYPMANVHLYLKGEDDGHSVWHVTAVDPVGRQSLIVSIDALSRQVVLGKSDKGGG